MASAAESLAPAFAPTSSEETAPVATAFATALAAAISAAIPAETTAIALTAVGSATGAVVEEARGVLFSWVPAWQPTFMQGFILGQISMLVLLGMAVKYILFEEPLGKRSAGEDEVPTTPGVGIPGTQPERRGTVVEEGGFGLSKFMIFTRKPKEPQPSDLAEELARMHKEILARTGYDLMARGPESCDWLTVFLAQIIAKFRADAERHDRLVRVISEALNGELRPAVIDNIRITQFSLGSDYLRITSARMVPSSGPLGMRAELDLALHDEITLGFDSRVLVNWPRPAVAALPVSMVVSLVKFAGTVAVEFECASVEPSLSISILPDYVLEFDVQTLIGSKAKVQNMPMLTSVISRKLQAAFAKELVRPNEKRVKIKHPFTPKPATSGTGHATAEQVTPGQDATPSQPHIHVPAAPRSPGLESNRPTSPTRPLVADLPPDYNTQLPPPHPLRSTANSRAAASGGNTSVSPLLGLPPRMYTPEEPVSPTSHLAQAHAAAGISPPQRPWSPASSLYGMSPRLRPVIGASSGSAFGPIMTGPRFANAGPRLSASYGGLFGAAGQPGSAHPGASARQAASSADRTDDELQVKDSVRQRVNRVIKTVNES